MKFLLDMGISPKTGKYLIELGHDATHLIEMAMERAKDDEILEKAKKDKSIILTHDMDFGRLLALSDFDTPSLIIFRLTNMKPDNLNSILKKVITRFQNELETGAILSIGDKKIRCHYLPLK